MFREGKIAIEKVGIKSNDTIRENFGMIKNEELRRAERE